MKRFILGLRKPEILYTDFIGYKVSNTITSTSSYLVLLIIMEVLVNHLIVLNVRHSLMSLMSDNVLVIQLNSTYDSNTAVPPNYF